MEYKVETSLRNFPAWQGGKDTLDTLIERDDCQEVEDLIETVFFDQDATDEDINDFLWFERDAIAEHLGYSDWESYENGEEESEDTYEDMKVMHHHPFTIGEIVWDDENKEWARVVRIDNEFPYHPSDQILLEAPDRGGMTWLTNVMSVYQIAEGLRTANTGDLVCYEHNETEDGYPYYCPLLEENFFSFEVVSELE